MSKKADQIRKLYAEGKSVAEIAEIVGCSRSYVRTAARQRVNGKKSRGDLNYEAKLGCSHAAYRYRTSKIHRLKMSAASRTRYRLLKLGHSPEFVKQKAREAYASVQ